jgi:hypothetical protein
MKMQIFVMPAWMAGIQARKDVSGQIHVNLGPGTPCRDDDYCNVYVNSQHLLGIFFHLNQVFEGGHERKEMTDDRGPMIKPVVRLRSTVVCRKKVPHTEIG